MLTVLAAFAAGPCDTPVSAECARAWRADDGVFYQEILELDRIVEALQDEPECPADVRARGYSYDWAGGCETTSGYWIELTGVTVLADPDQSLSWDLKIVATERADGSLPEGAFVLDMEGSSGTNGNASGSSWDWTATWSIDPSTSTVLRPEAALAFRFGGGSNGGCGSRHAAFETTVDGCPFTGESESTNAVWSHSLAGESWRLDVATSVCGSTLANGVFVDPETWEAVARTDADGDGCAVEDCDCNVSTRQTPSPRRSSAG